MHTGLSFSHRTIGWALLVAGVLMACGGLARAQEGNEQQGLDTLVPGAISVSNIDIGDVLILLSKYSGLNFTKSKEVKGPVTVELSNVTVRDVLEVILRDNGWAYMETPSGIVRVMTLEQYKEQTATEVNIVKKPYSPRYVTVDDLRSAFQPLLSKDGKITVVKMTNTVLVADRAEVIAKIDELYNFIDMPTTTRVFRLEYIDVGTIRQQLEALMQLQRGQIQVDEERNIIILTSTRDNLEKAAKIIAEFDAKLELEVFQIQFVDPEEVVKLVKPLLTKEGYLEVHEQSSRLLVRDIPTRIDVVREVVESIDVAPQAVWIEAEILNVNMDKLFELGVTMDYGRHVVAGPNIPSGTTSGFDGSTNVQESLFRLLSGQLSYLDFTTIGSRGLSVAINALEKKDVTQVLASPRVLVLNDKEAQLNIGAEEPFLVRQRRTTLTNDDYDIYSQRSRKVGIILTVAPHIIPSGYVQMEIELEDSRARRVQLGNQDALAVDEQRAETEVIIKDGRTVALGGLIKRSQQQSKQGVPILSQIPILGLPFRNTSDSSTRQKLLLFLTPHIVSVDDPYRKFQYDDSLKARMLEKDGVMGWLDRPMGLEDEDNPEAWYYQVPLEEREVYQPQSDAPQAPVLLPPGDYDEQGIFWTPGHLPPSEEPLERPAKNDSGVAPEATLEDVS